MEKTLVTTQVHQSDVGSDRNRWESCKIRSVPIGISRIRSDSVGFNRNPGLGISTEPQGSRKPIGSETRKALDSNGTNRSDPTNRNQYFPSEPDRIRDFSGILRICFENQV